MISDTVFDISDDDANLYGFIGLSFSCTSRLKVNSGEFYFSDGNMGNLSDYKLSQILEWHQAEDSLL